MLLSRDTDADNRSLDGRIDLVETGPDGIQVPYGFLLTRPVIRAEHLVRRAHGQQNALRIHVITEHLGTLGSSINSCNNLHITLSPLLQHPPPERVLP